ncbi:copper homeostasis protein [Allocatelliglobosispora scoriae]|uniref:Copper homeostasis protein cutC homolog n=1 Tax=Allocatelliglobosispora scoriae TaxID=643052 RepID=A0A841BU21_9ACTN|nr:copper homeostasis protein CutC [Allocatelliglobosispora scoriae]MBB5870659.1 copper homeostasis protein [Allocatelliglobosispora scoriae]
MSPLLEVIALSPADAEAAQAGGADRLELVADMAADGLSPDPRLAAQVVASTDLPVRAMVRVQAGFAVVDLPRLVRAAADLIEAGVHGLVLGFLDEAGDVAADACVAIADVLDGRPWTFHRAIDHSRDYSRAFEVVRGLPGLDAVLTAGSPNGVAAGLTRLAQRIDAGDGDLVLAGGGLVPAQVPVLRAIGVTSFHIGRSVRRERSWLQPVSAAEVRAWKYITSLPALAPSSPGRP